MTEKTRTEKGKVVHESQSDKYESEREIKILYNDSRGGSLIPRNPDKYFDKDDYVEMPITYIWDDDKNMLENLETIWAQLQKYETNPMGITRNSPTKQYERDSQKYISEKMEYGHTSMMVGDVVVVDGDWWIVWNVGFKKYSEVKE